MSTRRVRLAVVGHIEWIRFARVDHVPPAGGIAHAIEAWEAAGWDHEPRVSVSRSVLPVTSDLDRRLFGSRSGSDQTGVLDGAFARFGKTYVGEPDVIAAELRDDAAVQAADTILLTVPNQLGVDYNVHVIDSILRHVAPELGWR